MSMDGSSGIDRNGIQSIYSSYSMAKFPNIGEPRTPCKEIEKFLFLTNCA